MSEFRSHFGSNSDSPDSLGLTRTQPSQCLFAAALHRRVNAPSGLTSQAALQ